VPAFSAVKKEGIALYKLARRGRAVDPPKRMVEINAIQVLAWEKPRAVIRVECQAGTYIRSLAHDAGQRLGVGAHLAELTRTRSGDWRLETAIDLEALARVAHKGDVEAVLHPLDAAIQFMPKITLSAREAQQAIYGQELRLDLPPYAMTIRAYTPRDEFLAILERSSNQTWQPRKVFPPA
jgi:tRNA pseudouridine55 synthase